MKGFLTTKQRLKQVNSRLINENAQLRAKNKELEKENKLLKEQIEKLLLRLEELERIIFGKKKKKKDKNKDKDNNDDNPPNLGKRERDKSSYRRPVPAEEDVTDRKYYHFSNCPDCGAGLTDIKKVARYVEDILPLAEWYKAVKKIAKILITTGYCPCCQKRKTAIPIPKHKVSIGGDVKQFVSFATVILRLSYEQIQGFLAGTAHLAISDGEMANILAEQADILRPEFERLKETIRGQPAAHYDETSWNIQSPDCWGRYAWVMTGVNTPETVFLLGQNRGMGTALLVPSPKETKRPQKFGTP